MECQLDKLRTEFNQKLDDLERRLKFKGFNCEKRKEKQILKIENKFKFLLDQLNKLEKRIEENESRDDELFKRILNIEDKIIELKLR